MGDTLSNMFGGDQEQAPASTQPSSESSSQDTEIDGDGQISVDVGIVLVQEGSYEGADGSQNEWSHSNEVGVEADTSALVSSTSGLTDESSDFG